MNNLTLRKSLLFLCLLTGLVIGWAMAAKANESGEELGEESEKTEPGPTVVEVPVMLMPIATASGRMKYYAYLALQLEIPSPNDRWSVEDKLPYILDAFIRELHENPNIVDNNPRVIDIPGIKARLSARVHDIFGDDRVGEIIIKSLALPRGVQGSKQGH